MGNAQEWDPSQILDQCPKKTPMSSTVLQQSITHVPNSRENDRAGQENLETMKIESIHLDSESEEEIVYNGSDRRGSNPIYIHRTISAHKIQGKLSTRKFKCDETGVLMKEAQQTLIDQT